MISHYVNGSCTEEWLREMRNLEIECEPLITTHVITNLQRVVSRDAITGAAKLESEHAPDTE